MFCFASVFDLFAQNGTIIFANRNVPSPTGDGSTYHIPFWKPGGTGIEGAGGLPGGVRVGLFLPGNPTPFVSETLRTGVDSQFFAGPPMTVEVPGTFPGQRVTLQVRAWQYVDLTWEESLSLSGVVSDVWSFTTLPLGGTINDVTYPSPGLTGLATPSGYGFTVGSWDYQKPEWFWVRNANGSISIEGYNGHAPILNIFASTNGLRVTSIGAGAFRSASSSNIVVPEGIVLIDEAAFFSTWRLREIQLPNSVRDLGARVFQKTGLSSITLPPQVTIIPPLAFYGATNLSTVNLPGSLSEIGDYAFSACPSLFRITIPGTVSKIGTRAFRKSALEKVVVPAATGTLGSEAFSHCANLSLVLFMGNRSAYAALPDDLLIQSGTATNLTVAHAPGATGWSGVSISGRNVVEWNGPIPP